MERIINYIEVKIEDFRISGGTPELIYISQTIFKQLSEKNIFLGRIVNLTVNIIADDYLPKDGVFVAGNKK